MKRLLLSAIAIAVVAAGCGSGGSTTPVASKAKTTPAHKKHPAKKVVHHRKVTHRKKVVHHKKHTVVTTTAVTTTAATTTFTPPPTTTTAAAPPPTTTTTVAPTTTQQTTTHHKSKGGGNGGGHGTYCLSVTAVIATPQGSVPVARVRPGMYVWSVDPKGRRVAEKVLRAHHTAAPAGHLMVRLRLADGRHVLVSLGHPLANGEPIRTLAVGESFEGSRVVSTTRVVYGRPYTYDLLPAGPTHTYFADGVLLGSTLSPTFVPGRRDGPLMAHPF